MKKHFHRKTIIAFLLLGCMLFSACGKKPPSGDRYEVVDGKIVLVPGGTEDVIHTGYENGPSPG